MDAMDFHHLPRHILSNLAYFVGFFIVIIQNMLITYAKFNQY